MDTVECAIRFGGRDSSAAGATSLATATGIAAIRRCRSAGLAAVVSASRPYWWIFFRMFWCSNLSVSACSLVLRRTTREGEAALRLELLMVSEQQQQR